MSSIKSYLSKQIFQVPGSKLRCDERAVVDSYRHLVKFSKLFNICSSTLMTLSNYGSTAGNASVLISSFSVKINCNRVIYHGLINVLKYMNKMRMNIVSSCTCVKENKFRLDSGGFEAATTQYRIYSTADAFKQSHQIIKYISKVITPR